VNAFWPQKVHSTKRLIATTQKFFTNIFHLCIIFFGYSLVFFVVTVVVRTLDAYSRSINKTQSNAHDERHDQCNTNAVDDDDDRFMMKMIENYGNKKKCSTYICIYSNV
jgi:hypothetical protein